MPHWSSRLLASRLRVSVYPVYEIKPCPLESFRFSTDHEPGDNATDISALHLVPPKNAVVLCLDERSQT